MGEYAKIQKRPATMPSVFDTSYNSQMREIIFIFGELL
jgi:hypothetical protein